MLTEHQLEQRRSGIGSSDAAAVAGVDPWRTQWDIYNSKVLGVDNFVENQAIRFGNYYEDAVAKRYSDEAGIEIHRVGQTRRHPNEKWMLATPDRYALEDGKRSHLVEIKTASSKDGWGYDSEEVPTNYLCQVNWQMAVTDYERCDLAVQFLSWDRDFRIYRINRNDRLVEALTKVCKTFWYENVLAENPPAIDGSDAARDYVAEKYPFRVDEIGRAPTEAREWAQRFDEARRQIKEFEEIKKEAQNHLCQMIGTLSGIKGDWGKATWKPDEKGRSDWKTIAQYYKETLVKLANGETSIKDPQRFLKSLELCENEFRYKPVRRFNLKLKEEDR